MRGVTLVGTLLLLSGCRTGEPANQGPTTRADTASLQQRATQLWQARQAEDWDAVLRFEPPERQASINRDEFVKWQKQHQPFVIHSFALGRVQSDGQLGWVEANYESTMRQFPNVPARQATRWEKWQFRDGNWYPVPVQLQDQFPDAPALRNLTEEQRLRKRVERACQARMAGDWAAMHALLTPDQREQVTVENFVEEGEKFQYVECTIAWIQVLGERGQARMVYHLKSCDPSLTKLPPQEVPILERWTLVDGEWLLAEGAIPK